MNLAEFCSRLDARLSSLPSDTERLEAMAKAISQAFKAEVAIFMFDDKQEIVSFLWPVCRSRSRSCFCRTNS